MGRLRKKTDPLSARARTLNAQIASLQAEIQHLEAQLQQAQAQPRLRSTAVPRGPTLTHTPAPTPSSSVAAADESRFEEVDQDRLKAQAEAPNTPGHYNEFGVRKYDLVALVGQIRSRFRRHTPANPKLINYLAAGSIQGLRPLRLEKRVARNRFILLVVALFLVLLGIISAFVRHH